MHEMEPKAGAAAGQQRRRGDLPCDPGPESVLLAVLGLGAVY